MMGPRSSRHEEAGERREWIEAQEERERDTDVLLPERERVYDADLEHDNIDRGSYWQDEHGYQR